MYDSTKKHLASAAVLLLLIPIFISFNSTLNTTLVRPNVDLRNRITGVREALAGVDPYFYIWRPGDPEQWVDHTANPEQKVSRLTVPPTVLLLNIPLANLSFFYIELLWLSFEWILYLLFIRVMMGLFKTLKKKVIVFAMASLFSLSFHWLSHVFTGQLYFFYLFFASVSLLTFLKTKSGKLSFSAGFLLGAIISLRPQYAILIIPLILIHAKKSYFVGLILGIAALVTTSLVVFGPSLWKSYFSAMSAQSEITFINDTLPSNIDNYYPSTIEGLKFIRRTNHGYMYVYDTSTKRVAIEFFKWHIPTYILGLFALTTILIFTRRAIKSKINLKDPAILIAISAIYVTLADVFTPAPHISYYNVLLLPIITIFTLLIKNKKYRMLFLLLAMMSIVLDYADSPFRILSFFAFLLFTLFIATEKGLLRTSKKSVVSKPHNKLH